MKFVNLLVLGFLKNGNGAHGYAVYRQILEADAGLQFGIKTGSIYYAINSLAKSGDIMSREAVASTSGPEKTAYEVTPKGRATFNSELCRCLVSTDPSEFRAGLHFVHYLPRHRVLELLTEQIHRMDEKVKGIELAQRTSSVQKTAPTSQLSADLTMVSLTAFQQWTRDLRDRIARGELSWSEA